MGAAPVNTAGMQPWTYQNLDERGEANRSNREFVARHPHMACPVAEILPFFAKISPR
ncbi:hypothetical protein CHELA41_20830 [Hyphomicrobiales bacterium]|nr:hypothetical protein CHELA41_20830 [Hyphomicrobiales bacterium]